MANLILYDSKYGNTEKVARAIADILGAKTARVQDFQPAMLPGVSLLVVGSPVHAWKPSQLTQDFLKSLSPGSLKGVGVAAFDTRIKGFFSGSASDKVEKDLVKAGGRSVIKPAKFIVKGPEGPLAEGELENARHWARHILENVKP